MDGLPCVGSDRSDMTCNVDPCPGNFFVICYMFEKELLLPIFLQTMNLKYIDMHKVLP